MPLKSNRSGTVSAAMTAYSITHLRSRGSSDSSNNPNLTRLLMSYKSLAAVRLMSATILEANISIGATLRTVSSPLFHGSLTALLVVGRTWARSI